MQAFRPGKSLFVGLTEDYTIQSEPAADCFEALHLQVQLQEQPLKIVYGKLLFGGPTEDYTIQSLPQTGVEVCTCECNCRGNPFKTVCGRLTHFIA